MNKVIFTAATLFVAATVSTATQDSAGSKGSGTGTKLDAPAAIAPKPVFLCHHRPLRDTTGAGTAPHDNLSASAPSYTYAMGSTEDGYVHAWLDDPGAATLVDMGTRQVPYFNCSSITYVGGTKQFFSDPLVGLVVTLLPDDQTIELRYRDYGAGGLYTFWDSARGRVTTLKATP